MILVLVGWSVGVRGQFLLWHIVPGPAHIQAEHNRLATVPVLHSCPVHRFYQGSAVTAVSA